MTDRTVVEDAAQLYHQGAQLMAGAEWSCEALSSVYRLFQPFDRSDPTAVVGALFDTAADGTFERVQLLCAYEADDRLVEVCRGEPDARQWLEANFRQGEVTDELARTESEARVAITFGPDGDRAATVSLTNDDGEWDLQSLRVGEFDRSDSQAFLEAVSQEDMMVLEEI